MNGFNIYLGTCLYAHVHPSNYTKQLSSFADSEWIACFPSEVPGELPEEFDRESLRISQTFDARRKVQLWTERGWVDVCAAVLTSRESGIASVVNAIGLMRCEQDLAWRELAESPTAEERIAEKQASRAADAHALSTGEVTREQLTAQNTFIRPEWIDIEAQPLEGKAEQPVSWDDPEGTLCGLGGVQPTRPEDPEFTALAARGREALELRGFAITYSAETRSFEVRHVGMPGGFSTNDQVMKGEAPDMDLAITIACFTLFGEISKWPKAGA